MAAETQASDKKVGIVSTALRDTLQSSFRFAVPGWYLYAAAPDINSLGLDSIETFGGGALDQGMIRAGNDGAAINIEDAWLTSVVYRLLMPDTQSEALIRGGALNGYRQYPEDVQRAFVKEIVRPLNQEDVERAKLEVEKRRPIIEELQPGACDNLLRALTEVNLDDKPQRRRIEMLRVFSGSNDLDDMRTVINAAKEEGAKIQAEISYARDKIGTPEDDKIFTTAYYVDKALRMVEMGADRIGIKDFAGLLTAEVTAELVSALREALPDNIDIVVHSHDNAHELHNATDVYDAAVKNGATVVHASHGAMFKVGGHVGMEKLQEKWQGTEHDPKLDSDTLELINDYLGKVRKKFPHLDIGQADKLDERVLRSGAPGGGYYAAITQLVQVADNNYQKGEVFWKTQTDANGELKYPDKNTFREATLNKYFETLEGVRSSMGEVAMVTPFYKFADDQARLLVNKLIYSESTNWAALEPDNPATWGEITEDVCRVMLGKQGQMPGKVNPDLRYRVQSDAIKAEAKKQGNQVSDDDIATIIADGEKINDEYKTTKALLDANRRIADLNKYRPGTDEFLATRLAQAQEELQQAHKAFEAKKEELGREPISHEDYVRLLTSDDPAQAYLRASMVQLCKQADVLPPAMDKAAAEVDALMKNGIAIPHRGEAIITSALCDGQSVPLYPKMTKTEVHLRRLYDPNWLELLTPAQINKIEAISQNIKLAKDQAEQVQETFANNLPEFLVEHVPDLALLRGTDHFYPALAGVVADCKLLTEKGGKDNSVSPPNSIDDPTIQILGQLVFAADENKRKKPVSRDEKGDLLDQDQGKFSRPTAPEKQPDIVLPDSEILDTLRISLLNIFAKTGGDLEEKQAAVQSVMQRFGIPENNTAVVLAEIEGLRRDRNTMPDFHRIFNPLPKQTSLLITETKEIEAVGLSQAA